VNASAGGGFDPSQAAVVYFVFNDGWDFVVGNRRNPAGRYLSAPDRAQALPRYLNYLAHSLTSLRREHGDDVVVSVRLVEIAEEGISSDELAHLLAARVPGAPVPIEVVPWAWTRPFVEEASQTPPELYRSPNRMHEALILDILRTADRRYLAIVDPDVTFLTRGALWQIGAALVADPGKAVAAFIERGHDKPWQGGVVRTRDRIHSVVILADTAALRDFPFEPFVRVSSLDERLVAVSDPSVREHFATSRVLDTMALLTEWLRASGTDRLLDLRTVVAGYHEGQMLTIVCELLLHAKFLDLVAVQAIRETLAGVPWLDRSPRLRSIRERLGSGLILAR
jgi:hypothetical protein